MSNDTRLRKLEAEWEALYRRIWEGDRKLAGEVDDNISGRMGEELRPFVKAGRTILGAPGGHEAMGKVAEAVLPALLERHDPTF